MDEPETLELKDDLFDFESSPSGPVPIREPAESCLPRHCVPFELLLGETNVLPAPDEQFPELEQQCEPDAKKLVSCGAECNGCKL